MGMGETSGRAANGTAAAATIEVIGRYALCGEIASGGMASVHFGRLLGPSGFSRPVAIKKLQPQFATDAHVRAMFIDEARLAARVCHPNVVPTLDVVETDGELMLVMDYVPGEALGSLIRILREKHEGVPIHVAKAIVASVLHGLHAAHEARSETGEPLHIIHRDVSPQNILVGVDGLPRVIDFGIARAAVRLERTRGGILKGKLAYMAPEQFGDDPITRAVDVYAAGVVLWEMLAGRRLFFKRDEGVIVAKIFSGRVDKPSTFAPDVPSELDDLVMRAIHRDPAFRFTNARELALALEALGPLPVASEIGAWVQRTAPEALAARATIIEGFERTSATMRLTAARRAAGFPGVRPEAGASDAPYAIPHAQPFDAATRARRTWWLAGTAAVSVVAGAAAWVGRTLAPPAESAASASPPAAAATAAAETTMVRVIEAEPRGAIDAGAKSAVRDAGAPKEKEKRGGRRGS